MSESKTPHYSGPMDLDLLRVLMNGTKEEVEAALAKLAEEKQRKAQ